MAQYHDATGDERVTGAMARFPRRLEGRLAEVPLFLASIFGLEPNYGCCTANLSQGWPKFTAHLWMGAPSGGLAALAYAPSVVTVELGGARVTVVCETEYPFEDELRFTVSAGRPARFPLLLRVPGWAEGATLTLTGEGAGSEEHRGREGLLIPFASPPCMIAGA